MQPALKLTEKSKGSKDKPSQIVAKRRTRELIVALAGPVGSGLGEVGARIAELFRNYGYEVKPIKASRLIIEAIETLKQKGAISETEFSLKQWDNEADRIRDLQDMGDALRSKYGSDVVAQLLIKKISADRQSGLTEEGAENGEIVKEDRCVVWLVDSLKHPEEVRLLRAVYDKMFSLFGVLCSFDDKIHYLVQEFGIDEKEATSLIKRDESEEITHGQKLIKTLQFGDFFVRSSRYETSRAVRSISRYVKILLGDNSATPTHGEYAMYLAQSASYRSGCMSRQVGAAIVNEQGGIVATGFNDVPRQGGGLYTEDADKDARCFMLAGGRCSNDHKKMQLKMKVKDYLEEKGYSTSLEKIQGLFDISGLSDLTEYCRAVHAEMDALTSAARKGVSVRNGTMYVTTYPCHNCAKHIIAAGIRRVFYIEPYEKSLATSLHNDAITSRIGGEGVEFLPFEGVAPRQFQNRFWSPASRKSEGKFIKVELGEETPAYSQLLDCFAEYEIKIVDALTDNGL